MVVESDKADMDVESFEDGYRKLCCLNALYIFISRSYGLLFPPCAHFSTTIYDFLAVLFMEVPCLHLQA